MKNVIFLSGLCVPKFIAKSKFVWNESLWDKYNTTFITSKIPVSDNMVASELNRLSRIIKEFDNPIVAGHSLGAWWAANLACLRSQLISKLVLLTPLSDTSCYPIFNVTPKFDPVNNAPYVFGPHKTLVISSEYDLIVPAHNHANRISYHFGSQNYKLNGGHFYQTNHNQMISYVQSWIDLP